MNMNMENRTGKRAHNQGDTWRLSDSSTSRSLRADCSFFAISIIFCSFCFNAAVSSSPAGARASGPAQQANATLAAHVGYRHQRSTWKPRGQVQHVHSRKALALGRGDGGIALCNRGIALVHCFAQSLAHLHHLLQFLLQCCCVFCTSCTWTHEQVHSHMDW